MLRADYRQARSKAKELLAKYRVYSPPVDPEAIAEAEGIDVVYVDFAPGVSEQISGVYDFRDRRIYVNKRLPANRKTFTIAHELAHAVLHKDYAASTSYRAMPRSNVHFEKPEVEKQADVFAANLLVPKHMLKDYRGYASDPELAAMFAVSEDVVTNQKKYL